MRSGYSIRRATIDDLPALQFMWQALALPADELQNRLTEFQVIASPAGLLGGVGFEVSGHDGRVHSEVFSDFGFADHFRPVLWERIEALALSHHVTRIWTLETSPFWKRIGLLPIDSARLKTLPAKWTSLTGNWLCIQLRETADQAVIEAQMSALRAAERERTARVERRLQWVKRLSMLAAVVLAIFVVVLLAYMLKNGSRLINR